MARLLTLGIPVLLATAAVACAPNPPNTLGQIPQSEKRATSDQLEASSSSSSSGSGGACDLQRAKLKFSSTSCDACMQGKCCQETVRCVVDDPKCAELQKCLLACPKAGAGAGGGGGGRDGGGGGHDGGGGGNGGGGGASACEESCNARYPTAQTAQAQYNDCVTGRCGDECL